MNFGWSSFRKYPSLAKLDSHSTFATDSSNGIAETSSSSCPLQELNHVQITQFFGRVNLSCQIPLNQDSISPEKYDMVVLCWLHTDSEIFLHCKYHRQDNNLGINWQMVMSKKKKKYWTLLIKASHRQQLKFIFLAFLKVTLFFFFF